MLTLYHTAAKMRFEKTLVAVVVVVVLILLMWLAVFVACITVPQCPMKKVYSGEKVVGTGEREGVRTDERT